MESFHSERKRKLTNDKIKTNNKKPKLLQVYSTKEKIKKEVNEVCDEEKEEIEEKEEKRMFVEGSRVEVLHRDGKYYPGIVSKACPVTRYVIFDDKDEGYCKLSDIRLL